MRGWGRRRLETRHPGRPTQLYNLKDDVKESKALASEEAEKFSELDAAYKAWDAKNIAPLWKTQRTKDPARKQAKQANK